VCVVEGAGVAARIYLKRSETSRGAVKRYHEPTGVVPIGDHLDPPEFRSKGVNRGIGVEITHFDVECKTLNSERLCR
jgi:hypothetical protein